MRKFLGVLSVMLFTLVMCGTALADGEDYEIVGAANILKGSASSFKVVQTEASGGNGTEPATGTITWSFESEDGAVVTFSSTTTNPTNVTGTALGTGILKAAFDDGIEFDETLEFEIEITEGGGKSSSSGCDAGLGFLALALLGSIPLVLRRK